MKRVILIAVSIVLFAVFALPQAYEGRGKLKGFITDTQGNPIPGVTVKLYNLESASGFTTTTNSKGEWKAFWIRGGMWNIDFTKVGYAPKAISVKVKEYGRNPVIKIQMQKIEGINVNKKVEKALVEGNKLYKAGDYKGALEKFQQILQDNPDLYQVNTNIGNCYFSMKDYDKAIEYYKKVLEKEPNNTKMLMAIGNCYIEKKNYEEALKWYDKIQFDKIDNAITLYNIGVIYYNNNKYDQALKYFQRAFKIDNKFTDAIYQLGLTYMALNKMQEAIDIFNKYLEIDSTSQRANQVKQFISYIKESLKDANTSK